MSATLPSPRPAGASGGRVAAAIAGAVVSGLVVAVCVLGWADDAAIAARAGGARGDGGSTAVLALLAAAFAAYLGALALLRRGGPSVAVAVVVAVVVQLAPLGAPLLLSTDAWTYWGYGWLASEGHDPYVVAPAEVTESPALPWLGADWRDTTTVYGPAFTLASEPLAAAAGSSPDAAAWIFKGIAGAGGLAAAVLAGRLARRRTIAIAFVGWNPVVALHLAGGGHNDGWVAALLVAALALAASRRLDGAGVAWSLAVLLKWVPLVFLALRAVEARATGRATRHVGFAATTAVVLAVATWRYGLDWARAVAPLAANAERSTSYAIPSRLEQAGAPEWLALALAAVVLVTGLALLARSAHRGHAQLGLAGCLLLVTTPYLAVWYLAWPVALAAADERDRLGRAAALALCAYLLPQTVAG